MRGSSFARRLGAGAGIVALGLGLTGGIALAGSTTGHTGGKVHGTGAFDAVTVTFLPTKSPVTVPAGCWMPTTSYAYMSVSGNLHGHSTGNKNGFWATSTFTGTASVQPIATTPPSFTSTGTVIVDTTLGASFASGHLTIWDGVSVNKNTVVEHATLTFKGTMWTGMPVSMTGEFHFTIQHPVFNTTGTLVGGTPVQIHGTLTCKG